MQPTPNELIISSPQNPRVKRLQALQQKSAIRREEHRFVVEGRRELGHCLRAGLSLVAVYYCTELLGGDDVATLLRPYTTGDLPCFQVTRRVYEKLAYRDSTEGVLAEVEEPTLQLDDLQLSESPLIVVLERVEKPGNLGAVLRTADACHADAVIICDPLTDLYNPNLIRSSIGAIFTVPCVACSSKECIRYLQQHHIHILTAQLQDSLPYYHTDMCRPTAIIMGTESEGLTQQWRDAADAHIRIPMHGEMDSLNVSVSAAILLFEAVRQREA